MNHDEIIAILKGHKAGKVIQYLNHDGYHDVNFPKLSMIINHICIGDELRIKPEPRELYVYKLESTGEYIVCAPNVPSSFLVSEVIK